jgi:sRNA-binding regulator protein Hfq
MEKRDYTRRIGINPVYSYIKISISLQNGCSKGMEIFGVKEFPITADILSVNLRIHAISTVIVKQSVEPTSVQGT